MTDPLLIWWTEEIEAAYREELQNKFREFFRDYGTPSEDPEGHLRDGLRLLDEAKAKVMEIVNHKPS